MEELLGGSACVRVTSSVGSVHSFCWQTKLAEEWSQLAGGQSTAEHAHGLKQTVASGDLRCLIRLTVFKPRHEARLIPAGTGGS